MAVKIRFKESTTVLYCSQSKPFREGQNIEGCLITTHKFLHPENNKK
jgi:hypothetical protein